jgi:hypothetical protein
METRPFGRAAEAKVILHAITNPLQFAHLTRSPPPLSPATNDPRSSQLVQHPPSLGDTSESLLQPQQR